MKTVYIREFKTKELTGSYYLSTYEMTEEEVKETIKRVKERNAFVSAFFLNKYNIINLIY